jgi:hypothetical protein
VSHRQEPTFSCGRILTLSVPVGGQCKQRKEAANIIIPELPLISRPTSSDDQESKNTSMAKRFPAVLLCPSWWVCLTIDGKLRFPEQVIASFGKYPYHTGRVLLSYGNLPFAGSHTVRYHVCTIHTILYAALDR